MKKNLFVLLAALAFVGAASVGLAATEKKAAKTEKMESSNVMLSGVTDSNRAQIELLARQSGATHASLNVAKGDLRISYPAGKSFDRQAFDKKLEEKVSTVKVVQ